MGGIGAPRANRDLRVNVADALEEGLDRGVEEGIDVVYLVDTMRVLAIIHFAHINALVKTV